MLLIKKMAATILCLTGVLFFSTSACFASVVEINISGLSNYELAAFSLDISYDTNVLSLESYELTDQLGSFVEEDFEAIDDSDWTDDGLLSLNISTYLMDFSNQADEFVLVTLNFTVVDGADLSSITLTNILLGDEYGDAIPYTVSGTAINVVPIPSAFALMGFGLMGIAGLTRRSKN